MNVHSAPWSPNKAYQSRASYEGVHNPYWSVRTHTPEPGDEATMADDDARTPMPWTASTYTPLEDWTAEVAGAQPPSAEADAAPADHDDTTAASEDPFYYPPYRSDPSSHSGGGGHLGPYRSPALRGDAFGSEAAGSDYGYAAYAAAMRMAAGPRASSATAAAAAPKGASNTKPKPASKASTSAKTSSTAKPGATAPVAAAATKSTAPATFVVPKPKSAQARVASPPPADNATTDPVKPVKATEPAAETPAEDAPAEVTPAQSAQTEVAPRSYRSAVLKDLARTSTAATATTPAAETPPKETTPTAPPAALTVPLPRSLRVAATVPTPPPATPPTPAEEVSTPEPSDHLSQLYARLQSRPVPDSQAPTSTIVPPSAASALCSVAGIPTTASLASMGSPMRESGPRTTSHSSNPLTSSACSSHSSTPAEDSETTAETAPRPTTTDVRPRATKKPKSTPKNGGWIEVKGSSQSSSSHSNLAGRGRRAGGAAASGGATSEPRLFTSSVFTILTGNASASPSSSSAHAGTSTSATTTAASTSNATAATTTKKSAAPAWERPLKPATTTAASGAADATGHAAKKARKGKSLASAHMDPALDAAEQLLDALPGVATPSPTAVEAKTGSILILGIPLRCGTTAEDWTTPPVPSLSSSTSSSASPSAASSSRTISSSVRSVWSLLKRSLAVREESASAKLLLLERALDQVFGNSVWSHYTTSSSASSESTAAAAAPTHGESLFDAYAGATAASSSAATSSALSMAAMAHHILQRGYPLQLVCAVLLEASDCCAELDQSLRYAQDARDLAVFAQAHLGEHSTTKAKSSAPATTTTSSASPLPDNNNTNSNAPLTATMALLRVVEALGRLAITRALVRVIDITGAKEQLLCAAEIALATSEAPLLGWIALQLGITLELCGFFSQALRVYATAQVLATLTHQPRLLCDVLCCQSIARSAVGDDALANSLHQQSVEVLTRRLSRWSHLRPLQNMVQLKLQMGDMRGALAIHQHELALARDQHDAAAVVRCYGSIALAERYLQHYEAAAKAHVEELALQRTGDPRQLVECWTGAASCLLLAGQPSRALVCSNKAARYLPPLPASSSSSRATRAESEDSAGRVPHPSGTSSPPPCESTTLTTSSSSSNGTKSNHAADSGAGLVRDYCSVAKAWVERADILLQLGDLAGAESLVLAALEAMEGVTATERGQYLLTATMCELDWRCCCVLQRIYLARHAKEQEQATGGVEQPQQQSGASAHHLWHALQLSEACNTPNTTHARDLLSRRARQYKLPVPLFHSAVSAARSDEPCPSAWLRSRYLAPSLVTAEAVLEVLNRPDFHHRKIVLYSLPWTENSLAMAYVLSRRADTTTTAHNAVAQLHVEAITLDVDEEMTALLVSASSALSHLFDAPMRTWEHRAPASSTSSSSSEAVQAERDVVYGDTPLWPQHYSSTAFRFTQNTHQDASGGSGGAAAQAALFNDPAHCLARLYDCLVRPLESALFAPGDAEPTTGLTIVGDGIFSRIPFHALHDGTCFLTEKVDLTTCSSLALLCVLHAADVFSRHTATDTRVDTATPLSSSPLQARVLDVAGGHEAVRTRSTAMRAAKRAADAITVTVTTIDEHDTPPRPQPQTSHNASNMNNRDVSESSPLAPFYSMHTRTQSGDSAAETSPAPPVDEALALAAMSALVADQRTFAKDTRGSNRLYMAVHNLDGAAPEVTPTTTSLLELHMPVLPEVREDFCGAFVATDSHKRLAHAFDISHLWNLHVYKLVLCEGCGTYGGFSIHESGVPVYRALQYAGAARLLLPIGARTPLHGGLTGDGEDDHDVVERAVEASLLLGKNITVAAVLKAARCEAIAAGAPLAAWATYTLCGLP